MEISLKPEIIGHIFGMPVSNSLVLSLLVSFAIIIGSVVGMKTLRAIPGKVQNAIECIVEILLDFMGGALGSREQAKVFFPLVASFFLFILLNNWVGLLPGVGSLTLKAIEHGEEVSLPLFRAANSDLNTTLALALVSVIAVQIFAIRKTGIFQHIKKYIILNRGPVYIFVGLFEFVGEFARVLSFAFRLFGNIFAGEVLLVTIMTLVPFLAPVPFFGLELFVGFIQALVFSMLTLVFLKIATETVEH